MGWRSAGMQTPPGTAVWSGMCHWRGLNGHLRAAQCTEPASTASRTLCAPNWTAQRKAIFILTPRLPAAVKTRLNSDLDSGSSSTSRSGTHTHGPLRAALSVDSSVKLLVEVESGVLHINAHPASSRPSGAAGRSLGRLAAERPGRKTRARAATRRRQGCAGLPGPREKGPRQVAIKRSISAHCG